MGDMKMAPGGQVLNKKRKSTPLQRLTNFSFLIETDKKYPKCYAFSGEV